MRMEQQQPRSPARRTRSPGGGREVFGLRSIGLAVALLLLSAIPAAAQHVITGRVTDAETAQALAGVQVSVQGTAAGTLTDSDGQYRLNAPSGTGVLSFTRLGYTAQQVAIANRPTINVELASSAVELEGIVAIGYGERREATLTESIGVVSSEEIGEVTIASADQAIQGRVPGVQVTTESGIPGAPVAIRIRGVGTVGNTQPLYVVDGLPVGRGGSSTGKIGRAHV